MAAPLITTTTQAALLVAVTTNNNSHSMYTMYDKNNYKCFESNHELRSAIVDYVRLQKKRSRSSLSSSSSSSSITKEDSAAMIEQTYGPSIGTWCTDKVTDFSFLFANLDDDNDNNGYVDYKFNEPLFGWNTARAVTMEGMFANATHFNQPLDHLDVSQVEIFDCLLCGATRFNQDLSNWNIQISTSAASTVSMNNMFANATAFSQPLCSWGSSRAAAALRQVQQQQQERKTKQPLELSNVKQIFVGTSCPYVDDPKVVAQVVPSSDSSSSNNNNEKNNNSMLLVSPLCYPCPSATATSLEAASSPTAATLANTVAALTTNGQAETPAAGDYPQQTTAQQQQQQRQRTLLTSCQPRLESCVTDDDCCRDLFCAPTNVGTTDTTNTFQCVSCQKRGQTCFDSSDCCDKLLCGFDARCVNTLIPTPSPSFPLPTRKLIPIPPTQPPTRLPRTSSPTADPRTNCVGTVGGTCSGRGIQCCPDFFCSSSQQQTCQQCYPQDAPCGRNLECCGKLICSLDSFSCQPASISGDSTSAPTVLGATARPTITATPPPCRVDKQACDSNFPCCDGFSCSTSSSSSSSVGVCIPCIPKRGSCDDRSQCCDVAQYCSVKKGCFKCLKRDDPCDTSDSCCGSLVCLQRKCNRCRRPFQKCRVKNEECCNGLSCIQQKCVPSSKRRRRRRRRKKGRRQRRTKKQ